MVREPTGLSPELADVITTLMTRRQELGVSQETLEARMGIAKGLLSKWERGIRKPSAWLLAVWAKALGYRLAAVPNTEPSPPARPMDDASRAKPSVTDTKSSRRF
jgi:transcriptional regulator with XRE-family HTH domain